MNSLITNINENLVNAEKTVKEKRILGGMDLFHLKKEDLMIISKKDYEKLLELAASKNN
ncbi:hypothetical protein EV215_2063 [Hypnocyclicus thermotrophus]|uniref:Uncharacterized protein n=1 Tax=Hypnocyclicus thermotrophus TaxID=1627895 RepID=A0AA46DWU0_9FUSO|nr:hypothetical protein [Hypnocyclicus thermotrophus]TDT67015.1 hypothetical protein EV215_2063 [Hypnocyclicus thermotrophus]